MYVGMYVPVHVCSQKPLYYISTYKEVVATRDQRRLDRLCTQHSFCMYSTVQPGHSQVHPAECVCNYICTCLYIHVVMQSANLVHGVYCMHF